MAKTKVTNVSGSQLHFGFLPPHGVTLDAWQEVTYDGDLRTTLVARTKGFRTNGAKALQNSLDNGLLCIEAVAEPACSSSSSSSV
jgi:hypothetical protein